MALSRPFRRVEPLLQVQYVCFSLNRQYISTFNFKSPALSISTTSYGIWADTEWPVDDTKRQMLYTYQGYRWASWIRWATKLVLGSELS